MEISSFSEIRRQAEAGVNEELRNCTIEEDLKGEKRIRYIGIFLALRIFFARQHRFSGMQDRDRFSTFHYVTYQKRKLFVAVWGCLR